MNNTNTPLLEIRQLHVHFGNIQAVEDVTFDVHPGEILGIVGESGCGKSSLARAIAGLNTITGGDIIFEQQSLRYLSEKQWHPLRQHIQFIFQDPVASLNPRMTVLELIAEPLKIYSPELSAIQIREKVLAMMQRVGLAEYQLHRYAQEFSGGQCQRISIARALIIHPKLIICDESVSALDVSIKSQIINLLKDLQKELNLTILFISHDLSILKHLCDRILVMYLGHVMELSTNNILYKNPHHPYTQALLSSILEPDPAIQRQKKIQLLTGDLPSPSDPPKGCVFSTRCPLADDQCRTVRPDITTLPDGTHIACFKPS